MTRHAVPRPRRGRRVLRALGWGFAAAWLAHLLHALAAAPVAVIWLHDLMDIPYALGHHLGPMLRWGGLAASVAAAASLIGRGIHHLGRRILIFRV